jgi:hypothetical protein
MFNTGVHVFKALFVGFVIGHPDTVQVSAGHS